MSRYSELLFAIAASVFTTVAFAQYQHRAFEGMDCTSGPVSKMLGGNEWQAYSCNDAKSVVLFAAPGNPAMPFYFMFLADGPGHRVVGEGTGSRAATAPAYKELQEYSESQIQELIEQTKAIKPQREPSR